MPRVKREREEEPDEEEHLSDGDALEDGDDAAERDLGTLPGAEQLVAGPANQNGGWFRRGTVKKIRMHDFMTYQGTVVVETHPTLNLILGPNGTGKSSIVCALCIGLGGSPKTLARADKVHDFVRRGASSCWTEIILSSGGNGRDYTVRRTIRRWTERGADGEQLDRSESKYALNGRDTTHKEIEKLITSLNIQFDNLCQFLPQDRVSQFAAMNSYELLESTLRALGDASLATQHQQLIALRKEEKQAIAERDQTARHLAGLREKQVKQQRDFERFEQREGLRREARSLRAQAQWVEVAVKGRAAEAAKQRLGEKREAHEQLRARQEGDMKPIKECERAVEQHRDLRGSLEKTARAADKHLREVHARLAQQDGVISAAAEELGTLEEACRRRGADIAAARQKLAAAEEELARAPERPSQELLARHAALLSEASEARRAKNDLEVERLELDGAMRGVQGRIGQGRTRLDMLASRRYQVVQRLEGNYRGLVQLAEWVEGSKRGGAFRGPVLGPLAAELAVRERGGGLPPGLAAQYVQNTCWGWLGSFLVTCQEDEALLVAEARRRAVHTGVKVACLAGAADPGAPFVVEHPLGDAAALAGYGITHTVDELIEAPPLVMRALVAQCGVNTVYIGAERAAACMEAIAAETRVSRVLVGHYSHTVLRSRYNAAARTLSSDPMHGGASVLGAGGGSADDEERAALEAEMARLAAERSELEGCLAALDERIAAQERRVTDLPLQAARIKAEMEKVVTRRVTLAAAVERARRALSVRLDAPDPEARRPALQAAIRQGSAAYLQACRDNVTALRAVWASMQLVHAQDLQEREARAQLDALRAGQAAREAELKQAAEAVTVEQGAFESAKKEVQRAKQAAEEINAEEREAVRAHVATSVCPGALRQQADAKDAEADGMVCGNENVAREYARRQQEISATEPQLAAQEEEAERLGTRIRDLKAQWLPTIQAMVATVNASFAANMGRMGMAGEVALRESEDFDKYAVEIRVQFRNSEPMQLLTASRQSGGERSVATITYLVALQSVTDTPFRVVDEINQGMDPINERKVYAMLTSAASGADTPQCFLLTPKLLPDLDYGAESSVGVLVIAAGQGLDPADAPGMFDMGVGMYGERFLSLEREVAA